MTTLDEHIAQRLRESQRNGELQSAANWGKPLDLADGYAQTPEELRLGFKALKDIIANDPDAPEVDAMRQRLSELQQHLALRLEKLRATGSL